MGDTQRSILIFGGTFDPPHCAHIKLPQLAAAQLGCDEIIFVPAAINPLKSDSPPTPSNHRLAMLLTATSDVPNARVSTIELDRAARMAAPSYTIDTLRELREEFGGSSPVRFHLLIGCDQALEFHRWKNWQEIVELATPAVMIRPPWDARSFERELRKKYADEEAQRWIGWTLRLPLMNVNATEIRKRFREGQSPQGLIAPEVEAYIRANHLYHD